MPSTWTHTPSSTRLCCPRSIHLNPSCILKCSRLHIGTAIIRCCTFLAATAIPTPTGYTFFKAVRPVFFATKMKLAHLESNFYRQRLKKMAVFLWVIWLTIKHGSQFASTPTALPPTKLESAPLPSMLIRRLSPMAANRPCHCSPLFS